MAARVRQNRGMRNPDKWSPREPEDPGPLEGAEPEPSRSRRGALLAMLLIVLLVVGGLALTRVLRGMSQSQDCALSGRSNCN